jgi:purine-binding chemotaxis protein CheW
VVDAVSEVLRVNPDTVEPPSPIVTTADSAFIRGIAKVGERLVILLDLGKVLSITEQAGLAEMAVAA